MNTKVGKTEMAIKLSCEKENKDKLKLRTKQNKKTKDVENRKTDS